MSTLNSTFPSAPDGTLLGAWTDTGDEIWVKTAESDPSTDAVVTSGLLYDESPGNAARYQFSATPASADYTVHGTLVGSANQSSPNLLIRADIIAGNYYYAEFNPFDGHWRLHKVLGYGPDTTIGSIDVSSVPGTSIALMANGTAISLTVDSAVILDVTDSDISAAGHGGVGFTLAIGGSASSPLWSAWSITCAAGFASSSLTGTGALAPRLALAANGTTGSSVITGTGSVAIRATFSVFGSVSAATPSIRTVTLNEVAIEDLGLEIVGLTAWKNITQRTYARVASPLRRNSRVLTVSNTVAPREIGLRFLVSPTSVTDRTTRLDALAATFNGPVTVRTADAPDRVAVGLLRTAPVTSVGGPSFVLPAVYADCTIVCDDPLWYDAAPTTLSIAADHEGTLTIGTASTRKLVITVNGPATNLVVILRDQTATERARMTLTGTLAAGESIVIDCDAYTITLEPDGTDLLQAGWLGASETFFELRPPSSYTLGCPQAALAVTFYRAWET